MNSPCDTCAFGKSGGAADEVNNRLRGMICAYGAQVFWCHHSKLSGEEYDWKESKLGPLQLPPRERKVCGGWQKSVAHLKRRGFFDVPDFRVIRQFVARKAFRMLNTFLNKETAPDIKEEARISLRECMEFITAKDIGDKEIPL